MCCTFLEAGRWVRNGLRSSATCSTVITFIIFKVHFWQGDITFFNLTYGALNIRLARRWGFFSSEQNDHRNSHAEIMPKKNSHEGKEVWTLCSDCDIRNSCRKVFVTLTLREHTVQDEFAWQQSCDALERKKRFKLWNKTSCRTDIFLTLMSWSERSKNSRFRVKSEHNNCHSRIKYNENCETSI